VITTCAQLFDALLLHAGNWFVLNDALEQMHQLELKDPSPNGRAWAKRVLSLIDCARASGCARTPAGLVAFD